jgi:phosphate acetyltransferase
MKINLVKIMEEKAKKKRAKIVVCEGWDERCLKAADDVLKNGFADLVLLGNPEEIEKKAKELKVDITKANILDFKNSELTEELAEKLFELRKHKGMTLEQAKKLLQDENYFGCMYVYAGHADGVCSSAICPTAALMRPALQILRKKDWLVSEVAIIFDPKREKYFFMTDPSMNIEPTAEELAKMAINAAEAAKELGVKPKIAMLSFSTKGSGGDVHLLKPLKDAVELVKKQDPKLLIDGELQFDAAISEYGCERKCPDSPLKGDANVIVFPNLTASNIFIHGMMQFSDMKFDFSMIKGMEKPVCILGRSTPLELVRNMYVVCAMEANKAK